MDLQLLRFAARKGIGRDLLTDHDLDTEGAAALALFAHALAQVEQQPPLEARTSPGATYGAGACPAWQRHCGLCPIFRPPRSGRPRE